MVQKKAVSRQLKICFNLWIVHESYNHIEHQKTILSKGSRDIAISKSINRKGLIKSLKTTRWPQGNKNRTRARKELEAVK